jgi:hypothetical protein
MNSSNISRNSTGGSWNHTHTANLPNHLHSISLTTGSSTDKLNNGFAVSTTGLLTLDTKTQGHTHTVTGNTGSPTSTVAITINKYSTLPPYYSLTYLIFVGY